MESVVHLGGNFLVRRNGIPLGPAPTATTAVLLIALAESGSNWCDRDDLAKRLYPDLDPGARSGALRVSVHRLRAWIGAEEVESGPGRLRLVQDWRLDFALSSGERAQGSQIAPGLHHPILDRLRMGGPAADVNPPNDLIATYAESVRAAADEDPNLGRGILAAGLNIAESMHPHILAPLLSMTMPKNRHDSYFAEFHEIAGSMMIREGAVPAGVRAYQRGLRQAIRVRTLPTALRIGYRLTFTHIEAGAFVEASRWLSRLEAVRPPGQFILESANAHAALLWNANRMSEAMDVLAQARPRVYDSSSRSERMHYAANFAVLATESGEVGLATEILDQAMQEASGRLDRVFWLTRDLVIGKQMINEGHCEASALHLRQLRERIDQYVDQVGSIYAMEWEAEALAKGANPARANLLFRKVCARRRDLGFRVNPRTMAKIERAIL